ncbi:MAG TPA: hypothetical protein VIS54_09395 [Psychromonas sp.]
MNLVVFIHFSSVTANSACQWKTSGFPAEQKTATGVIEKFIMPVYPDSYKGWQQAADFQLSGFSKIEYVPIEPRGKEIPALYQSR